MDVFGAKTGSFVTQKSLGAKDTIFVNELLLSPQQSSGAGRARELCQSLLADGHAATTSRPTASYII